MDSNAAFDPFVEHVNRKLHRHELDPDVASMILADYAARDTAIREPRQLKLEDIGRPKPLKHTGRVESVRKTG